MDAASGSGEGSFRTVAVTSEAGSDATSHPARARRRTRTAADDAAYLALARFMGAALRRRRTSGGTQPPSHATRAIRSGPSLATELTNVETS